MEHEWMPIIPFFAAAAAGLVVFVLYVISIVWAYGDAEARGKSGCLVALLVAFVSWPLGLLLWVVFRPVDRRDDPWTG